MNARGRATAILEVLGVYLAGGLVTLLLARVLVIELVNPLNTFSADVTDAELIVATWQLFVLLMLQYVGYFLLILPLNWWHRRRGFAAYGLTLARHAWTTLVLAGLATAALVQWPVLSVSLADAIYDLGPTAPWREALFATSWRRWEFWLFSAVTSWAVVAVVEELFFRGYCQRRLAEDWGDDGLPVHVRPRPVFDAERVQRGYDREPPDRGHRLWRRIRLGRDPSFRPSLPTPSSMFQ